MRQCLRQRSQWQSLVASYTVDKIERASIFEENGWCGWSYPRPLVGFHSINLEVEHNLEEDGMDDMEDEEMKEGKDDAYLSNTMFGLIILIGNPSLLDFARLAISTLKRRKMKMNKHKLKKRRKLLRAKRESRK